MRGNQAFIDSQRAADRVSNARADEILRTNPTARAYYETIMSRVPAWKPEGLLYGPGSKSFELGERVKIKMPLMTVVKGCTPSKTGIIIRLEPIMLVRPSRWPDEAPPEAGIEFYPNEVERYATNVRRTLQARRRAADAAKSPGDSSVGVRGKGAAGKRRGSGRKVPRNIGGTAARARAARD